MQRETQSMDNTEKLQYVLLRLKNIYKITATTTIIKPYSSRNPFIRFHAPWKFNLPLSYTFIIPNAKLSNATEKG